MFTRVGPDGTVYFSDQPDPGAREIEVAPPQTITLPPVRRQVGSADQPDQTEPTYTAFAIVSPANEEGARANNGNVTIQLALQPELEPGHKVMLTVDGEDGVATKSGVGMSLALTKLSRGRHTAQAVVVDDAGEVLIQTDPVSFYVLRVALGVR